MFAVYILEMRVAAYVVAAVVACLSRQTDVVLGAVAVLQSGS